MDTQQQKLSKVLVIGESCDDVFVYGGVNRLCPEAPAPVFNPSFKIKNAGMAGNLSNNMSKLVIRHELVTNPNVTEIKKIRYVDERSNMIFIRVDENDDKIKGFDVKSMDFSKYDVVVIADYCKGFLSEKDISYIIDKSKKVFLDTKKILGKWCEHAFIIKINSLEFNRTKHTLTEKLSDKVICTIGQDGCRFRGKIYPVKKVEIKDVSGAGDTFLAGLVYKFCMTGDIEKAIGFANACSTSVVQKRGVSSVDAKSLRGLS